MALSMPGSSDSTAEGTHGCNSSASETPVQDLSGVQALLEALDKFRSKKCLQHVRTILDQNVEFQNQLEREKAEAVQLKRGFESREADYKLSYSTLLATHRSEVAEREKEKEGCELRIMEIQEQLSSEKDLTKLQTDNLGKIQIELKQHAEQLESKETQIAQLAKQGETKNAESMTLRQEIENLKGLLRQQSESKRQLSEAYNKLQEERAKISKQFEAVKKEFDRIRSYTRGVIHSEDPRSDDISTIWESTCNIVMEFMGEDLPDHMLQNTRAWGTFMQTAELPIKVPIPFSNSSTAKFSRGVVVLYFIASALNAWILQPVDLEVGPELREALVREAKINPEKEVLCRALLLSMVPDGLEDPELYRVATVIRAVSALVECLVTPQKAHGFVELLRPLLENIVDIWSRLCRCKCKVEADVDLDYMPDWNWETVSYFSEDVNQSQNDDEEIMVLFPRVYAIRNGKQEAIFPGIVLREWQLSAADHEMAQGLSQPNPGAKQVCRRPTDRRRPSSSARSWKSFIG